MAGSFWLALTINYLYSVPISHCVLVLPPLTSNGAVSKGRRQAVSIPRHAQAQAIEALTTHIEHAVASSLDNGS
jgi:hypothetical protein